MDNLTLKFRLVNYETGEVIDCDKVQPLRSIIKDWAISGTQPANVRVIQKMDTDKQVGIYLKDVFHDWSSDNCDICNKWVRKKDMDFLTDSEDIVMVAGCKHCLNLEHDGQDDEEEFESIVQELEHFKEEDDDLDWIWEIGQQVK